MTEKKIKAIVTDLDGVIRHFPAHRDGEIEQRYDLPLRAISKAAFDSSLLQLAITGKISDEEWRSQIQKNLLDKHGDRNVADPNDGVIVEQHSLRKLN